MKFKILDLLVVEFLRLWHLLVSVVVELLVRIEFVDTPYLSHVHYVYDKFHFVNVEFHHFVVVERSKISKICDSKQFSIRFAMYLILVH